MRKKYFRKNIQTQGGQVMIVSVVFFLFVIISVISGLIVPTTKDFKRSTDMYLSRQSFFLSESGGEDAYYRLKNAMPISSPLSISLNGGTATTIITDVNENKVISALGDFLFRQRTNEIVLATGDGVSFVYGIQSGQGGITMGNNSKIIGSVYSNGSITGSGEITGSATSANAPALFADQVNDTNFSNDITFGNTTATQDFAQSFQVSTTQTINKIDLYLKKVSTPSNLTVRIVADNLGSPSTTQITSGSLSASLVSTSYGWVSVPFSSNPLLLENTTYWFVIDGGNNSTKYYMIGANDGIYSNGVGKIGRYTSSWNNLSPISLDGFFKIYLGGGPMGLINGITVGASGVGNTYAHTVNNSNIAGVNYCKVGSGNNKPCDTSLSDPSAIAMPISEQNIEDWKNDAEQGGVHNGDLTITGNTSFGPKKITGDLIVTNGGELTLSGSLWVLGDINISNNATVRLDPAYGSSEGIIITDGVVSIGNNSTFYGSGTSGSYPMVLSTSTSDSAITLSNNAGAVILYAANGTISIANNAGATSVNGYKINLSNNAIISYDIGLINANFVSGPTGGWNAEEWREIE